MLIKRESGFTKKNLLSTRVFGNQENINEELIRLNQFMAQHAIVRNGSILTAVYSSGVIDSAILSDEAKLKSANMDIEISIPVIEIPADIRMGKYTFVPEFELTDVVHTRYIGHPMNISATYEKIRRYIEKYALVPVTPVYNHYITDIFGTDYETRIQETMIDIYIGVTEAKRK